MSKPWSRHQETGYPSIDPGMLRHVVTIQQYGPTSPVAYDDAGQVNPADMQMNNPVTNANYPA